MDSKYYYKPRYRPHYMIHALKRDFEVDKKRWERIAKNYGDYVHDIPFDACNFKDIYIKIENLDPVPRISKVHDAWRVKFPYYNTSNPPCNLYHTCHEGKGNEGFICPYFVGFDCGGTFFVVCKYNFDQKIEKKPIQLELNFDGVL